MGLSNGILHLPFTKIAANGQGDLQVALGSAIMSQAQLFASQNVNKWAKFKPIKQPNFSYADQMDANQDWLPTATWWKGMDGQCGLTFTTYDSLSSFFPALLAGLPWGYDRPVAGGSYPLRTYDFNQYYMYAPKPVTGVYNNLQLYNGGQLTVQLDESRGSALTVQLSDLTIYGSPVGGWYVGILIYKSASQYTFAFSTNTIGGVGDLNVEFSGMTSYAGSVTVVPFLSSVRSNQGIDPGAGVFLSCDVLPRTANIEPEVQSVVTTINAQWRDSFYVRVGYDVNILNNTYSNFTVNNLLIALYDGYQNINTRSIGTATIPARDHTEYSGVFIVDNYDPNKTYTLVVTSDSQYVTGSKVVDAPRT